MTTNRVLGWLATFLCCVSISGMALAQTDDEAHLFFDEPEQIPLSDEVLDTEASAEISTPADVESAVIREQDTWKDIVALPPKPFLKRQRLELSPYLGLTVNDTLMHHTSLGLDANYFLTEVLAVGLAGQLYFDSTQDLEFLTRYHLRRVPSLNRYLYTASANFSYVPVYGKFTVVNRYIFHWEFYALGGIGITGTKVIPRDAANEAFSNTALTFPIGLGGRLFINRWLAVHISLRDYMMIDTFEPATRGVDGAEAKRNGETRFVNNVMFQAGVSFFFPTSFSYRTFR